MAEKQEVPDNDASRFVPFETWTAHELAADRRAFDVARDAAESQRRDADALARRAANWRNGILSGAIVLLATVEAVTHIADHRLAKFMADHPSPPVVCAQTK